MKRAIAVAPLGLITQPNEIGQYPIGAMVQADNCYIRSPGCVEPALVVSTLHTTTALTFTQLMVPSDSELLQIFFNGSTSAFAWRWFSASTNNVADMTYVFNNDGRCSYTRSRNRFLVTSNNGPLTFDFTSPTNTAERTPRLTGLPAPTLAANHVAGTGNALAANTHASCTCLIRRTYADGYELVSAVSIPSDTGWSVLAQDIVYSVTFAMDSGPVFIKAGDVIEFYRTRAQSSGVAGVGGTSCDAVFFLTKTYTITSSDVANGFAGSGSSIPDSTPDTGLGEALYTNPGLGGAQATRISPPQSNITCTFKGYTFLFGLVEAAQLQISILGGIGYAKTADPASWRASIIGARDATATWTNGSNVLTGISAAHIVGLRVGQTIVDASVFGTSAAIMVTAVGASTLTLAAAATVAGGTKDFRVSDTLVVDGSMGVYSPTAASSAGVDLSSLMSTLWNGSTVIGGPAWNSGVRNDVFQAASLAYFPSTFLSSPTPQKFSIAKMRAVPVGGGTATVSVTATNGQNYQPALPEFGSSPLVTSQTISDNGFAWCEEQEPDAWPPANRGRIGSGKVLGAVATRDAVWIFATDGLWRLSGDGGAVGTEGYDWRVDPVDSTLILSAPQALCVLRDTVYAYTNRGIVSVSDESGINDRITEGVIGNLLPGPNYSNTSTIQLRADLDKDEVWISQIRAGQSFTEPYVYNYNTKAWVRSIQMSVGGAYSLVYWPVVRSVVQNDDTLGLALYFNQNSSGYARLSCTWQPIYGSGPFEQKQWTDATCVLSLYDGRYLFLPVTVFSFGFSSLLGGSGLPAINATDARLTVLVPRNTPARAESIEVNVQMVPHTSNVPQRLIGLSVRYTEISEQQIRRNA